MLAHHVKTFGTLSAVMKALHNPIKNVRTETSPPVRVLQDHKVEQRLQGTGLQRLRRRLSLHDLAQRTSKCERWSQPGQFISISQCLTY